MAKASFKGPDSFGKGNLHAIAAAESANSAVVGSNLIPLLLLGIPSSVGAALTNSAFMIRGVQLGPLLFSDQGRLIYGLFGAMVMTNVINLLIGQIGLRVWIKVVSAPESMIYASALLLCIVGVSIAPGGLLGMAVMLVFAALGYFMTVFGYSAVIFIIAFFLGPRFEMSVSQSLAITNGDLSKINDYPIALALLFLAAAAAAVWWLAWNSPKPRTEIPGDRTDHKR
ncbi:MAG: hypothetical protein HOL77_00320 [Rhodobacteraceae bacterium]|nr:hypothetical protein [Paracoccaceae bacterium]